MQPDHGSMWYYLSHKVLLVSNSKPPGAVLRGEGIRAVDTKERINRIVKE